MLKIIRSIEIDFINILIYLLYDNWQWSILYIFRFNAQRFLGNFFPVLISLLLGPDFNNMCYDLSPERKPPGRLPSRSGTRIKTPRCILLPGEPKGFFLVSLLCLDRLSFNSCRDLRLSPLLEIITLDIRLS